MALATEIRKSVTDTTPLMAVVGATDLAVERVREFVGATDFAVERVREFDGAKLQAKVTSAVHQAPAHAVAVALEAASRAELKYEALAARGKDVVERVRTQKATQDLIVQGRSTLSRTKAAVTTGRKGLDETLAAARDTVTTARKQVVGSVVETGEAGTKATAAAAKKTTSTARKHAASTRSAAKGVVTSAGKTADKAAEAVGDAVDKIGDVAQEA